MDGRPYIIPSKGIDAPSISKTNYGEKLGEKIKKGMTTLAKAHEGDVKERKDKATKHAGAVKKLAMLDARAGMERSGKADLQYPASPINKPHLDAAAKIKKIGAQAAKSPTSPVNQRQLELAAEKKATHEKAAASIDKLKAKAKEGGFPSSPLVNRPSGGSPVMSSYKTTKRGRRVTAAQGAPGDVKGVRTPRRVTGDFAPAPKHGGQSGAQFRSL